MLTSSNTTNTGQNKTITYNLLNRPQTVTFSGGTITYTYDAGGNKLRQQSSTLGNTEYIDGIQYGTTITGLPDFIQTEEGRAVPSGTTAYKYYYTLSDHLGNSRLTFDSSSGTATTLQKDDYLPFGMEISRSVTSPKNEYLYNNKELQEELEQYDYGARFYDPVMARWMVVDPLAEKSRRWSPYNYVLNNPIRLIDPDGMVSDLTIVADPNNAQFQSTTFNDVQKLTNTQLVLLDDGTVMRADDVTGDLQEHVVQTGTAPTAALSKGTAVVNSAIDSEFDNKIDNNTNPNLGNSNVTELPDQIAAANGQGSGFTIHYNPNYTGESDVQVPGGIVPAIKNADGSTGRPGYIGLGHELVHGNHANNGKIDNSKNSSKVDPDSGTKGIHSNEEINTRKEDSQIRNEHGVPERAKPSPPIGPVE